MRSLRDLGWWSATFDSRRPQRLQIGWARKTAALNVRWLLVL